MGGGNFHCTPCTPGSQKWGDNVPHAPRLRRPCVLAYMAVSATESDVFSQPHRIHEDCLCELICHTSRFLVQETVHRRWTDAYPYVSDRATSFLHFGLSLADLFAPIHVSPISCRFSLNVVRQVFVGLPGLRLPLSGGQFMAMLVCFLADVRYGPQISTSFVTNRPETRT